MLKLQLKSFKSIAQSCKTHVPCSCITPYNVLHTFLEKKEQYPESQPPFFFPKFSHQRFLYVLLVLVVITIIRTPNQYPGRKADFSNHAVSSRDIIRTSPWTSSRASSSWAPSS
ncbi:hypothetical protein CEXT_454141 [Caerostris extrusa]|uniref:Uncharacterized protein n=1 Tax=Caerostris extrusa TaxID=172846 RepID=A0AAV4WE49_CAEEX|nr:hypothetical protein CEXT_454141 [Caerostris extrusa]